MINFHECTKKYMLRDSQVFVNLVKLLSIHIFDTPVICFQIPFFSVLINRSGTTEVYLLWEEYIVISFLSNHSFTDLVQI